LVKMLDCEAEDTGLNLNQGISSLLVVAFYILIEKKNISQIPEVQWLGVLTILKVLPLYSYS
jgi:hypothetical protein